VVDRESPYPKHPDLFSSFPSVAAGEKYVFRALDLRISTYPNRIATGEQKSSRQAHQYELSRNLNLTLYKSKDTFPFTCIFLSMVQ
jgi:hypothetical protein